MIAEVDHEKRFSEDEHEAVPSGAEQQAGRCPTAVDGEGGAEGEQPDDEQSTRLQVEIRLR